MTRLLPYVLKTLWRHRSRTILTVVGSAIALFVFCFVGAVQEVLYQAVWRRQRGSRNSLLALIEQHTATQEMDRHRVDALMRDRVAAAIEIDGR